MGRLVLISVCALWIGCGPIGDPDVTDAAQAPVTLTVYSGQSEASVGPLFAQIPADAGFQVDVQYGDSAELVARLLSEGEEGPADVILVQDAGHLVRMSEQGVLQTLPATIATAIDPRFRDPAGRWIGLSGRLRVLVVDGESVTEEERPQWLKALAAPRWRGRIGWAPASAGFQAHISALRHLWGAAETETWLRAVMANTPVRFSENSLQVAAVNSGAISLAWVDHMSLIGRDPEDRRAVSHSFPTNGDVGNLMMLSAVGIRAGSPRSGAAADLVAWLSSERSQAYFAQTVFEYPTRVGVEPHPGAPLLEDGILAEVDPMFLTDLEPTVALLQRLGVR